jgi:hypothetical protein
VGTRRNGLLAAVVVSSVLTGCGGSSDASKVTETITRAFHALATGDGATLCSLATEAGQKTLAAGVPHASCEDVVKLVAVHLTASQKAALESVQIKRVEINGDRATVSDAALASTRGSLKGFINPGSPPTRLTKQSDGNWKLSG